MPITGTFEADFSQFSSATQGAVQDLDAVKQSATSTTNAVTQLETATKTHAGTVGNLHTSYTQFDSVLSAVGIHIGPQVRALEEIGAAAGKTAGQLGLLASASLVVGTAMAAWQTGKWIGETTGMTDAISKGWAAMLGYGDVANQTAQAVDQSIVLAFQRTGKWARDGAEALRLNTQWANENQKAAKEASKEHKIWADAMVELNSAGDSWKGTLQTIDGETVEAVKYYLAAGVSQSNLAKAYALTDAQVQSVATSMAAEKKATEDAATATDKAAAAAERYAQAWERSQKQTAQLWAEQGKAWEDLQRKEIELGDQTAKARLDHDLASLKARNEQGLVSDRTYNAERLALQQNYFQSHEAAIAAATASDIAKLQQSQSAAEATVAERYGKGLIDESTYQEQMQAIRSRYRIEEQQLQETADTQAAIRRQAAYDQQVAQARAAADKIKQVFADVDKFMSANSQASFTTTIPAANITDANRAQSEARLAQLQQGFQQFPGRAPGGSGKTGLASDDLAGYTQMLRERIEYESLKQGLAGRAAGGPVAAGTSYLVGERGPEVFTPGSTGAISPNGAGGRGGVTIVINGSLLSTKSELAALVEDAMVAAYRRGGNRLPV